MAVISLFMSNMYKSEARILPADGKSGGGIGQMAAAAAAMGVSMPGGESADAAYVDIIKSRWMNKKLVLEKYRFRTRSFCFGAWKEREQTLYDYFKAKSNDGALRKLKSLISVSRDLKTRLITITVETKSPELSQQIVRKVVGNLEEFVQTKGRTKGSAKAAFALERLKDFQTASTQIELELTEFMNVHRNFTTSNDPIIRIQGTKLENTLKLRQQVMTTLTLNYEQALLEEKNDMPILNVLDEGDIPEEKSGPNRLMLSMFFILLVASLDWLRCNRGLLFIHSLGDCGKTV